jgi:hypothetical protein
MLGVLMLGVVPTKESIWFSSNIKVTAAEANIATASMLPAYCDPPNPCPLGYTSHDGCIEVNSHIKHLYSLSLSINKLELERMEPTRVCTLLAISGANVIKLFYGSKL